MPDVLAALIVLALLAEAAFLARPGRGRGARRWAAVLLAAALLAPPLLLLADPPVAAPRVLAAPPVGRLLATSHLLPAMILLAALAVALALRLRARRVAPGRDAAGEAPDACAAAARRGFHAWPVLLAAVAALAAMALGRRLHAGGALLAAACLAVAALLALLPPRGEAAP